MKAPRRIEAVIRGDRFTFIVGDGTSTQVIVAHEGETIATALLAAGITFFRHTWGEIRPRGVFCAAGSCFDCLVEVDDGTDVRACVTYARPGMRVRLAKLPQPDCMSQVVQGE